MLSKKDLLERLKAHPLYQAALASVDEEQAKKIAALTERFLGQAADGMIPMIEQASDPEKVVEVQKVVNEVGQVISTMPVVTGSKVD